MLHTLAGSQVQISVRLPDQACFVCADRNQFDNALVNLAANARDAMKGHGQLVIAVRAVTAIPAIRAHHEINGDFVAVSLSDNGTGIAAVDLDKIFEPFFTTKDVGHGTGLGLSQVFGFAKQSGGEVLVHSTLGKCTTFTLYLPRLTGTTTAATTAVKELPIDGSGINVLLVKDNAEVGRFTAQ
jgi:signal transduction histidine kinase